MSPRFRSWQPYLFVLAAVFVVALFHDVIVQGHLSTLAAFPVSVRIGVALWITFGIAPLMLAVAIGQHQTEANPATTPRALKAAVFSLIPIMPANLLGLLCLFLVINPSEMFALMPVLIGLFAALGEFVLAPIVASISVVLFTHHRHST